MNRMIRIAAVLGGLALLPACVPAGGGYYGGGYGYSRPVYTPSYAYAPRPHWGGGGWGGHRGGWGGHHGGWHRPAAFHGGGGGGGWQRPTSSPGERAAVIARLGLNPALAR